MEKSNEEFNEMSGEFNPGQDAVKKLIEHTEEKHENPEAWPDRIDADADDMPGERMPSGDTKPDAIFLYFKEVNPMGLTLADLKDELLEHIVNLKEKIHDTAINESLSIGKRAELARDLEQRIIEKEKWVSRIDYFFMHDSLEPHENSPLPEHRKKYIQEGIKQVMNQQKHPDQN